MAMGMAIAPTAAITGLSTQAASSQASAVDNSVNVATMPKSPNACPKSASIRPSVSTSDNTARIGPKNAIATAASSATFAARRAERITGSGAMNSADRSARSPARLLAAIIGSRNGPRKLMIQAAIPMTANTTLTTTG